jgi:hypothetical protein
MTIKSLNRLEKQKIRNSVSSSSDTVDSGLVENSSKSSEQSTITQKKVDLQNFISENFEKLKKAGNFERIILDDDESCNFILLDRNFKNLNLMKRSIGFMTLKKFAPVKKSKKSRMTSATPQKH